MASIWPLPGPARFTQAIRAQLGRGCSVVVGLPGHVVGDEAFCAGLLYRVDDAAHVIDDRESGSRPLASLIAERFSISDIPPGPDASAALARHSTLWGRTLAIMVPDDGQQSARWADFARTFVAASKTVDIVDRPRLLLFSGKACAAALAGSDPLLAGLWWWGVLDRFDTAFHVRGQLPDGREELLRDAITEVAGFDLRLADHLANEWDGSDRTLAAVLARFPGPGTAVGPPPRPLPHSSTALCAPPTSLLAMWDQGLVDRWDSFPAYLHACAVTTAADLQSRVWRAQIRALMPSIDEERARIEAWFRHEIKCLPGDGVLEPGDLYLLLQDHPRLKTWRGGHRKQLIYWLRDARNTLAHMRILSPAEIALGRQLMNDDRRHG